MKTKQKTTKTDNEVLEDLPVDAMTVVCNDDSDCILTKEALSVLIADSIYEGREAIYDAMDNMIATIAEELVDVFKSNSVSEQHLMELDASVAGVRKATLIDLFRNSSDITSLVNRQKASLEFEFLDVESLTKKAVRLHFPNAFKKWEREDDELLSKLYSDGASWGEISKQMSRNINALKLRAEKLGIATNTGARTRF